MSNWKVFSVGSKNYWLLAVIVIAFNLILSFRYYKDYLELLPDPKLYYETAKTIAQGEHFIEYYKQDVGERMAPGYSYLLAGLFILFGDNIANVFFLNILLHVFTALLLFYLMDKHSNKLIAWCFSIWLLLYYQIWRMNFSIMMEISTIFFISISFFFLYKYNHTRQTKYVVIFSILAGLLVFVNNRFIFHFSILIAAMLVYASTSKFYKLKNAFILGFGILIVLLPWHIRQYMHYNEFVIFAPERTELIMTIINPIHNLEQEESQVKKPHSDIQTYEEYLEGFESIAGMTQLRMNNIRERFTMDKYQGMVKYYKKKYSSPYYKYLSRLTGFWNIWQFDFSFNYGGDTRMIPPARESANLVNIVILTPMFLFFVVGIFYAFHRKQVLIQMLVLFIFSHWILHGLVGYITRYRITVLPVIFLIAWYGMHELHQTLKKQKVDYYNKNYHPLLRYWNMLAGKRSIQDQVRSENK